MYLITFKIKIASRQNSNNTYKFKLLMEEIKDIKS